MRAGWLLIVLCGCGRVGFSDQADATTQSLAGGSDGGGTDGGGRDAKAMDAPPADLSNVALYSMDSLTATDALPDLSGFGNLGACSGSGCPVAGAGQIASALAFDGVDDIIRVPSSPSLMTAHALTVAAWLNSAPITGAAYHCLLNKPLLGGNADSWQLCVSSDSTLFAAMRDGSAQDLSILGMGIVPAGDWVHVAMTWDGSNLSIYVDAQLGGSVAVTSIDLDTGPVTIGNDIDNGALNAGFEGSIDDVRIYNRALLASEIAQLAAQ